MTPTTNLCRAFVAPDAVELRADGGGDGNTMFGHFAVFNDWTEINSVFEGRFLERLAPGAFMQTIEQRGDRVKVLYDHGADPSVGNKPLGTIKSLAEDKRGVSYEVSLLDTPYVNDLKPAIRANLLGASFRFSVTGEDWVQPTRSTPRNPERLKERTITSVDLYEFGPVTFPAYDAATAGMRSSTDRFLANVRANPEQIEKLLGPNIVRQILAAADGSAPDENDDERSVSTTEDADGAPVTADRDPRLLVMRARLLATR